MIISVDKSSFIRQGVLRELLLLDYGRLDIVRNLSWSAFFGIILIDSIRLRSKAPRMDTIEHFSDFLRGIGAHNFLALGIAIIVLWLLVSGLRKGLKKNKKSK